ncbi:MAG TPA: ABC transporter permease [Chthonomonas sp.]|uniref:ABC transporter permease n=1 Tax=Chthonomonas sp. TaxID=2282153 RepID=UPI002B4B290B|nr:ABC transporter permease [Chthonomonas sp.]HLI50044.1 ABC transporter permease [Chthonomonas sp.]
MSKARSLPPEAGVALVLALIIAFFSWRAPDFATWANIRLLTKQSAELMLVSLGMTFVIATGGIDLSVGSLLGLSGMVLGIVLIHGGSPLTACLAALGVGLLVGALHGVLIGRARMPSILVTLASYAAARAGATMVYDGGSISAIPLSLNELFDNTLFASLPVLLWVSVIGIVFCWVLLRRTSFGRSVLALGGNRRATYLSGVPTAHIELLVYMLSGLCVGLAAIIDTALKATATPDAGQYLELQAITAVVLGGTAITGGQATILGTALGVAVITVLLSGVRLMGMEDRVGWFFVGVALLLAVEAQRGWKKKGDI